MTMAKESSSIWADIKKYEEIFANDPNSYCFTILSELYRKLGLLDEAINAANRGIEIHPAYIGGHMAAGRAYFDKGMKEESRKALERVARVTPDNLLAQKLLMQIYIEQGNISEAEKTLRVIELLNPGDVGSRQILESHCQTVFVDDDRSGLESTVIFGVDEIADEEASRYVTEDESMEERGDGEQSEIVSGSRFQASDGENNPLPTATLAELYVSQGYLKKAMDVYKHLLENSSENEDYKIRLQELRDQLSGTAEETFSLETGSKEENISTDLKWDSCDSTCEIPEGVSTGGKERMILSILESWLVNIDRGRNANEGNTQKYC